MSVGDQCLISSHYWCDEAQIDSTLSRLSRLCVYTIDTAELRSAGQAQQSILIKPSPQFSKLE